MTPLPLHIQTFCLGDWQTNCYVLHRAVEDDPSDKPPRACWIIDAGFEPLPLIKYIQDNQLQPKQIILTHAHIDHIAGLSQIRDQWKDIPILIHRAEQEFLTDPMLNLSIILDKPFIAPLATGTLEHGQTLQLDGLRFEVRHTPGHSPGGISLYQPDGAVVIVGDTLFAGSIGRTDFPNSDLPLLIESIRTQLLTLPDETRVLSGHGPTTTIGQERANNPYLNSG